ncbi:MAG: YhfC family intramembrane metalloprotease [Huintestinicola sp.]
MTFSSGTIAAMAISGLLCILIPVAALIVYKVKNKDIPVWIFFIGGAVFMLFALILEQISHYFMLPLVMGNTAAYVVYGTLAAGVFEETGRFLAFKTVMKKRTDPKTAVMYGLGHGGWEAILLAGLSMVSAVVTALMTNAMGFDAMVEYSAQGDPATAELVRAQIEAMAALSTGAIFASVLERIIAMTFHTAISVIVFESAKVKGRSWLFPVCILVHALLDVPAALYQRQAIPAAVTYLVMAVFTAAVVYMAYRSYKNIGKFNEENAAE